MSTQQEHSFPLLTVPWTICPIQTQMTSEMLVHYNCPPCTRSRLENAAEIDSKSNTLDKQTPLDSDTNMQESRNKVKIKHIANALPINKRVQLVLHYLSGGGLRPNTFHS